MSPNSVAALLMVASMVSFTLSDTFVKLTGGALPLSQLVLLRGGLATALIFGLAGATGGLRWRLGRRAGRLVALRCLSEVVAAYFFLNALINMPLANVMAILQALPLTVTLGAWLVFGEPVGWRRMAAIGAGFVGVLLILRPGGEGFSIWSVYALCAVLSVTCRDLVTRRLPPDTPSLLVTFWTSFAVTTAFGLASLAVPWQPVTPRLGALLAGSAVFILAAYSFSVQVMRQGDVGFVAPFRYSGLVAALILGFVVFGEWPGPLTLLGAGIVVAAGLFTFWRERQIVLRAENTRRT